MTACNTRKAALPTPGSSLGVGRETIKFWFTSPGTLVVQVGPIHFPDRDSWLRINGELHDVPEGRRAEIDAQGNVTIFALERS